MPFDRGDADLNPIGCGKRQHFVDEELARRETWVSLALLVRQLADEFRQTSFRPLSVRVAHRALVGSQMRSRARRLNFMASVTPSSESSTTMIP